MNVHVDPLAHGSAVVPTPSSRLALTERDERMLALRDEGAKVAEIGAALGLSSGRVVRRVTELRSAGHFIPRVGRERATTRAPRTFADQFCEHRVYIVAVDLPVPPPRAARPVANAEARRQHREALERRQRMAAAARPPALAPTPKRIVAPVCRDLGPVDRMPSREQVNAHVQAWQCARRLACAAPVQQAIMITARHFGIDARDIIGPSRTRAITRPRQIAMYLAKMSTKLSLPEIGRRFGGKDHTTVLHAFRKIERLVVTDPDVGRDVETLRALLEEARS